MATTTRKEEETAASTRSGRPRRTSSSRAAPLAADLTAHRPLQPFTVEHFRAYANLLVLDNGQRWGDRGGPEQFQLDVVEDIFGPTPEVWEIVPEGNGKTTLMGSLALYYADFTISAAVLLGAASRDQCGLLLGQAAGFVYRTPGLHHIPKKKRGRFQVFEGYRRIDALRTRGRIQVYAADDRTGDGVIPGGIVLLDELHRHRDLRLYRTWRGKLAKRGAKLAAISTAGEPESEFEEARAAAIRGATDITVNGCHTRAASDEMVIHDYSVPAGGDIEDLELVKGANPLPGITIEQLRTKRNSPTMTLEHWKRFVCNQATRGSDSAITPIEWAQRRKPKGIPAGEPVWCGADFAWKWDTTALVPLWLPSPTRRVIGDDLAEILTPPRDGTSLEPEIVQKAFEQIHDRNPIHTVVMDESAGGAQMASWIRDELGAEVVFYSSKPIPMALAYSRWMEALREGWLEHTGDPEFARHVFNAVARVLPGGDVRFDRPANSRRAAKQDRRVWDALTAACMVHSTAVAELDVADIDPSLYRIEAL